MTYRSNHRMLFILLATVLLWAGLWSTARTPTTRPRTKGVWTKVEMCQMHETARALREHYLRDPYRPGYHFVRPENYHGPVDPNGAIFWKGRYHLFYLYQTHVPDRKSCPNHWGHSSSVDMVHWRHHLPAVEPDLDGTEKKYGFCWSGDSFDAGDGKAAILYWGDNGATCLATSTEDDLSTWTKHPDNPVIPASPPGEHHRGDHAACAWKEGKTWYCIRGGQIPGQGDTVFLFKSSNLVKWKYLHPFYKPDRKWTRVYEDNACPDFFKLGEKYMMLFISHHHGCQYYLGRCEDEKFHPEIHQRMSIADNALFAPDSLEDDRGRRIMWAWTKDGRPGGTVYASGWSGSMCLPRVLSLGDDGTLRQRPPKEFERIRYDARKLENLTVKADAELPLRTRDLSGRGAGVRDIQGNSIELAIDIVPDGAEQFGVKVCRSPGGEEQTLIYYDATDKKLKVDTRKSGRQGARAIEALPFELRPRETLKLRVFVDKSYVDVFANDRQAITRRIYPSRKDSVGVALFSNGGPAKVPVARAWKMMASNPY